jgi:hypothetical protein
VPILGQASAPLAFNGLPHAKNLGEEMVEVVMFRVMCFTVAGNVG